MPSSTPENPQLPRVNNEEKPIQLAVDRTMKCTRYRIIELMNGERPRMRYGSFMHHSVHKTAEEAEAFADEKGWVNARRSMLY